jgi:hypothetical protein
VGCWAGSGSRPLICRRLGRLKPKCIGDVHFRECGDWQTSPIPVTEVLPTIHSVAESGGLSDVFVLRSAEFLGESYEKPFRSADVAEPIRVFILNYFAYELRAALAELFKRLVDVVHGEHDAEVA